MFVSHQNSLERISRKTIYAFILVILVIIALNITTLFHMNNIKISWHNHETKASQKAILLSELRDAMGYGGFIHHFKNYVIRKEDKKVDEIHYNTSRIKSTIAGIRKIGVNKEEENALITIEATVDKYMKNMVVIERMVNENKSIKDIDHKVKINDGPALEALLIFDDALREKLESTSSNMLGTIETVNHVALFSMLIIALLLVGFMLFITGTFKRIIKTIVQTKKLLQYVSEGNLDESRLVQFNQSSHLKKKQLYEIAEMESALSTLINRLKQVSSVAENVEAGHYDDNINLYNEKDILAIAVNNMIDALKKFSEENKQEAWLKSGQIALIDEIRMEEDIKAICQRALDYVTNYLDGSAAVCYLAAQDETFNLICSHAFDNRKWTMTSFVKGQGLVGQVALEQKPMIISDVPKDYIQLNSGLGEQVPQQILLFPCILNNEVKCIMEICSFSRFNETALSFIKLVQENIAISITASQNKQDMALLLQETQEQSESLQQQQYALKSTNEELEEQTQALKQSEEELRQQAEELRAINEELAEKTTLLEKQRQDIKKKNKALKMKQKEVSEKAEQLATSSKYKSEFLANMSHELRTPLNSLIILSELLLENHDKNLNEDQLKTMSVINHASNDLLVLINDILDLSKVEAGKLHIHIEETEIKQVVYSIENQFMPLAQKKHVQFVVEQDSDVPATIQTDRCRLEQILKNLLSNAFKFTEQGTVTLKLYVVDHLTTDQSNKPTAEKAIVFSVKDTGIGIPENQHQAIFEAFQQVDASINRKFSGTGLGLAITTQLTKLLNGVVKLESTEGEGSTFTITFPLHQHSTSRGKFENKQAVSQIQEENQALALSTKDDCFTKENNKLLIIEDDKTFSDVICNLATEKGYDCLATQLGETGIALAISEQPCAIILDLTLPDLDGIQVLEQLKENDKTKHIPVHISSCRDEATLTLKLGAISHSLKPVSKQDLEATFSELETVIRNPIKNILMLVQDEETKETISASLNDACVHIHTCTSGHDAITLVAQRDFDCVVFDLHVSDMPAVTFLEQLCNQPKTYPHVPVIVYTSEALSKTDYESIKQFATSIILNVSNSPERLIDEISLFLYELSEKDKYIGDKQPVSIASDDPVLKDKKILLVDDDMRNIYALSTLLRQYGLQVIMAANGRKALDILAKAQDYDLILMDIMMPELDGYETTKRIREKLLLTDIPIIAVTAKAMKGDKEKCIEAGANDYLVKPIETKKLLSMMKNWIAKNEK